MTIHLHELPLVGAPDEYKLHFAQHDGEAAPLDVFVRDREAFDGWQAYRPKRNDFNRPFIFSLVHFYPDRGKATWLFTGIYRVLERLPDRYEVELTGRAKAFIGRLVLRLPKDHNLPIRPKLGTYYRRFEALEVLREPYSG